MSQHEFTQSETSKKQKELQCLLNGHVSDTQPRRKKNREEDEGIPQLGEYREEQNTIFSGIFSKTKENAKKNGFVNNRCKTFEDQVSKPRTNYSPVVVYSAKHDQTEDICIFDHKDVGISENSNFNRRKVTADLQPSQNESSIKDTTAFKSKTEYAKEASSHEEIQVDDTYAVPFDTQNTHLSMNDDSCSIFIAPSNFQNKNNTTEDVSLDMETCHPIISNKTAEVSDTNKLEEEIHSIKRMLAQVLSRQVDNKRQSSFLGNESSDDEERACSHDYCTLRASSIKKAQTGRSEVRTNPSKKKSEECVIYDDPKAPCTKEVKATIETTLSRNPEHAQSERFDQYAAPKVKLPKKHKSEQDTIDSILPHECIGEDLKPKQNHKEESLELGKALGHEKELDGSRADSENDGYSEIKEKPKRQQRKDSYVKIPIGSAPEEEKKKCTFGGCIMNVIRQIGLIIEAIFCFIIFSLC